MKTNYIKYVVVRLKYIKYMGHAFLGSMQMCVLKIVSVFNISVGDPTIEQQGRS